MCLDGLLVAVSSSNVTCGGQIFNEGIWMRTYVIVESFVETFSFIHRWLLGRGLAPQNYWKFFKVMWPAGRRTYFTTTAKILELYKIFFFPKFNQYNNIITTYYTYYSCDGLKNVITLQYYHWKRYLSLSVLRTFLIYIC